MTALNQLSTPPDPSLVPLDPLLENLPPLGAVQLGPTAFGEKPSGPVQEDCREDEDGAQSARGDSVDVEEHDDGSDDDSGEGDASCDARGEDEQSDLRSLELGPAARETAEYARSASWVCAACPTASARVNRDCIAGMIERYEARGLYRESTNGTKRAGNLTQRLLVVVVGRAAGVAG